MQFMLLCCFNEQAWSNLPQSERDRIMLEYGSLIESLKSSGHLKSGAKLDACSAAVTVADASLTDGPFAETKEQLGGYHVVECENREEAIAIAQRIPTLASGGRVEVRPVLFTE